MNDIIVINDSILKSLQTQKARTDQLFEEYQDDVDKEMGIPSNKFLYIFKILKPFMDAVVSSKLVDYEIINQYKTYLEQVVEYEEDYVVSNDYIRQLEKLCEKLSKNLVELEDKFSLVDPGDVVIESKNKKVKARIEEEKLKEKLVKIWGDQAICNDCGGVIRKPEANKTGYCSKCSIKHRNPILGDNKKTWTRICKTCGNEFKTEAPARKFCLDCDPRKQPPAKIEPEISDLELEYDNEIKKIKENEQILIKK